MKIILISSIIFLSGCQYLQKKPLQFDPRFELLSNEYHEPRACMDMQAVIELRKYMDQCERK